MSLLLPSLRPWLRRPRSGLAAAAACVAPLIVLSTQSLSVWSVIACSLTVLFGASLSGLVRRAARIEDGINLRTAMVTPARIVALVIQALFVFALVSAVRRLSLASLATLTFASSGLQATGSQLAYRGRGDRIGNSLIASAVATTLVAGVVVWPHGVWLAFVALGDAAFFLYLAIGCASDARAFVPARGGIGVFFGTFNPVHRTHLAIIRQAIRRRSLDKVYIHPTTVPRLHRDALAKGEIRIRREAGMRCYETTPYADPNKNYFPTGARFFEYEVRRALLSCALKDAGLAAKTEVLHLPEIYERGGFAAILAEIRRRHPGTHVHGMHGSDPGGIWVRNIFDSAGWIYPYPVRRRNNVSATTIREGAWGMTTPTVEAALRKLRRGEAFILRDVSVSSDGRIENRAESSDRQDDGQAAASAMIAEACLEASRPPTSFAETASLNK